MSTEIGNLNYGISAVAMSEGKFLGKFLTISSLAQPIREGNYDQFYMKLLTYTIGAPKPIRILKELGSFKLKVP